MDVSPTSGVTSMAVSMVEHQTFPKRSRGKGINQGPILERGVIQNGHRHTNASNLNGGFARKSFTWWGWLKRGEHFLQGATTSRRCQF